MVNKMLLLILTEIESEMQMSLFLAFLFLGDDKHWMGSVKDRTEI